MESGHDNKKYHGRVSEVQEFILMIRWQYPPHQWPQVKSLTMVRKVAFGVGFGVLLILSVEVLSSFLVTSYPPSQMKEYCSL